MIFKIYVVLLIAFVLSTAAIAQEKGSLAGTILDEVTGEPIIGASVYLEGTNLGAASAVDGSYLVKNIEPGSYNILVSYISYQKTRITSVDIKLGEVTTLSLLLVPETELLGEITVTAEAILNNEAGLLRQRQKSISFSDAISSERISKSGASDAAGVMKKVVGASVIGGKYIYIRGLGDRYSSSHLNGVELPSSDPDKKSFQFDMFPSNLLENIVTIKSFTPDKPGNFSGGLVDVNTKEFPEKRTLTYSFSSGYNTSTTGKIGYLAESNTSGLLAYDNGMRAIPKVVNDYRNNPNFVLPTPTSARFNADKASVLDKFSNAFNNQMAPSARIMPINTSSSISFGNQTKLFDKTLGYSASLSYSRKASSYSNGTLGRWQLIGNLNESSGLTNLFDLNDLKSEISVDIGLLTELSYKLSDNHKLSANYINTRSGIESGRNITGVWNDEAPNDTYQSSVIQYIERKLNSYQLHGRHSFSNIFGSTLKWTASYANNAQEEPDLRYLTYLIQDDGSGGEFLSLSNGLLQQPARFFRDLSESNTNFILDYEIPLMPLVGMQGKFKTGYYSQIINRDFNESRFEYATGAKGFTDFKEDINSFFGYMGIVDEAPNGRPIFGNTIRDASNTKNQYNANKDIHAYYAMLELPISNSIKLIGGIRQENTTIRTVSEDTSLVEGNLNNRDLLPAISSIVSVNENMNIRASYTNTVARPTFRELAPYTTFEFVGDFIFTGNAELKRTLIKNSDLRWEWFPNPTEIIAISLFQKGMTNPIERKVRTDVNRAQTVENVEEARVYGLEVELRKNLGNMSEYLNNFSLSSNFTLVESRVSIPEDELYNIRISDPKAKEYRSLVGQSPYIINFDLEYYKSTNGLLVNFSYNKFGDRLYSVALGAIPDVFERSYSTIDMVAKKSFKNGLNLKFSIKNLLDPDIKLSQKYGSDEYIYQSYNKGRSISLGLSYSF
ncbi:MAG: TonB-dependent receptor [Balneolaceae bacterium]